jgi:hypothetical protein
VNITLTFIFLAILAVSYFVWIRPWQLRWGATDEEIRRAMPGDRVVAKPSFDATRGVTVHALPQAIYPWIVQIGMTCAGWYGYDLLDNLGRPSETRLIPCRHRRGFECRRVDGWYLAHGQLAWFERRGIVHTAQKPSANLRKSA